MLSEDARPADMGGRSDGGTCKGGHNSPYQPRDRVEPEALGLMATRFPELEREGWDEVISDVQHAEQLTAYLWFPKGAPHLFDRVEEANRRGLQDGTFVPASERTLMPSQRRKCGTTRTRLGGS